MQNGIPVKGVKKTGPEFLSFSDPLATASSRRINPGELFLRLLSSIFEFKCPSEP
jgi:hypothetical protein